MAMTKKELTALAKSHSARTVCNARTWGFYYISVDQILSFLKGVTEAKASTNLRFDEKENEFSITVFLK